MTTTIQHEIMEVLSKLDDNKQLQVLEYVRELSDQPPLNLGQWLELARASRARLRAKYGEDFKIDVQSLLDEVREERLDGLLGSR